MRAGPAEVDGSDRELGDEHLTSRRARERQSPSPHASSSKAINYGISRGRSLSALEQAQQNRRSFQSTKTLGPHRPGIGKHRGEPFRHPQ